MSKDTVVHLYHNAVSPYRLPIFEELNKEYDLRVFFAKEVESGRRWDTDVEYDFNFEFLPSIDLGPFCFNYSSIVKMIKQKPDVHLHTETHQTLFTILCSILFTKLFSGKVILWTEWIDTKASKSYSHFRGINRVKALIGDIIFRLCRIIIYNEVDQFVAYSDKSEEYLLSRGVNNDEIVTGGQIMPVTNQKNSTPKNIEYEFFEPSSTKYLFIGDISHRKGIENLVNSWKNTNLESGELIIVGEGPEKERLQKMYEDDSIEWMGYLNEKDKKRLLSESDVLILPTLHDPWGLVINEAIANYSSVITTTAAGGSQLIFKQECGIVVSPDEVDQLSLAISLMTNSRIRAALEPTDDDVAISTDIKSGAEPFIKAISKVGT